MDVVLLEIREPGRDSRRVVVSGPADVGRECSGFLVDDRAVSRRHIAVAPHPEGLSLTDLGSRNGTLLNGQPLTGTAVARPGDVVLLGATRIEVVGDAATAPDRPMRTMAIDVPPAPPAGATSPPVVPPARPQPGWTPPAGGEEWAPSTSPMLTRRGPAGRPPRPDAGKPRQG